MRRISGIITIASGTLLSGWALHGAKKLHDLLEDEGTESFSASIGFGGLMGCIAFLIIVGGAGVLLVGYGVHVSRRTT